MTPDTTPSQGKPTQSTIDYFENVVYPDWPKKQTAVHLRNAVPEAKRGKIKPQKKEIPTTIRLECGCTASVLRDGTTYQHHIKGCTGEEMD